MSGGIRKPPHDTIAVDLKHDTKVWLQLVACRGRILCRIEANVNILVIAILIRSNIESIFHPTFFYRAGWLGGSHSALYAGGFRFTEVYCGVIDFF